MDPRERCLRRGLSAADAGYRQGADTVRRRAPSPAPMSCTIWGIALGILVFAAGVVAWALSLRQRSNCSRTASTGSTTSRSTASPRWSSGAMRGPRGWRRWPSARSWRWRGCTRSTTSGTRSCSPRPIEIWALGFSAGSAVAIARAHRRRCSGASGARTNPVIKATWLSSRNDVISTTGFRAARAGGPPRAGALAGISVRRAGRRPLLPGELGDLALGQP